MDPLQRVRTHLTLSLALMQQTGPHTHQMVLDHLKHATDTLRVLMMVEGVHLKFSASQEEQQMARRSSSALQQVGQSIEQALQEVEQMSKEGISPGGLLNLGLLLQEATVLLDSEKPGQQR